MALVAYGLVVVLALLLVHRLAVKLSLRECAAIALFPLLFVGKALLTGGVYAPLGLPFNAEPMRSMARAYGIEGGYNGQLSDLYTQMMPWRAAVRHALWQGEWPHLNPFILAGDVLAGSAQPAPWHPLTLIAITLPPGADATFLAATGLFLSLLGAWVWLKSLGCRPLAAAVGAFAWMASDFVLFWIGWPIGMTASMLPWLLFAVGRLLEMPRTARGVFLTLVFVWILFAGHPETVLHHVAIGAAFGLWRLRETRRVLRPRAIGLAVLAGGLALAMTAIATLPFQEAISESFESRYRHEVWSEARKSRDWTHSAQALLPSVVPFAYGRGDSEVAVIENPQWTIPSTAFAGLLLLPLAAYGVRRGVRRDRAFLLALLAVGIWVGAEAPGLTDFLGSLPLFSITLNERLILGAAFALCTLAGIGLESYLSRPRRMELAFAIGLSTVVAGLLIALLWPAMLSWELSPQFLARNSLIVLLPSAAAVTLVLGARKAALVATGLLILLGVERYLMSGSMYPSYPSRAFYPPFPGIDLLHDPSDTPWRTVGRSFTLIPGTSAMYGLEDPRGYQAMTNQRLKETMTMWSIPQNIWFNRVDDLTAPYLDALNVRWAIDSVDYPVPPGWKLLRRYGRYRIVEKEQPVARAWIPEEVIVTGSGFPEAMRSARDFRQLGWVGPPIGAESAMNDSPPRRNGEGTVEVVRDGNGLQLTAEMQRSGWIFISQTAWQGWRARDARGRMRPLHYANHALLAMALEPGTHDIRLWYEPRTFDFALTVTLAGWAAFLFMALGGLIARFRARGNAAAP